MAWEGCVEGEDRRGERREERWPGELPFHEENPDGRESRTFFYQRRSIIAGVRNTDREADVRFYGFRVSHRAAVRQPIPALLPAPLDGGGGGGGLGSQVAEGTAGSDTTL